MKTFIICCAIFCVVNSLPTDTFKADWKNFKESYGKKYSTEKEDNTRFLIFSKNLDRIREHNKQYDLGLTSYKMSVNKFADLTDDEFQKMFGYLPLVESELEMPQVHYRKQWELFKKQFGKVYSLQQDEFRFRLFCKNLDMILKHNEDYKKGITTFEMALNNFSDMTLEEIKKYIGVHSRLVTNSEDIHEGCKIEWKKFKESYDRTFTNSEDKMRFKIFCDNLQEVNQHNADYEKGLTTYKMTINKFSDRTTEEMRELMGFKDKKNGMLSVRVVRSVDDVCHGQYKDFRETFNKIYDSDEEEMKHMEIFCKNIEMIKRHNEEFEKGHVTFKMAVNRFTDMTTDEIKRYLGFLSDEETLKLIVAK